MAKRHKAAEASLREGPRLLAQDQVLATLSHEIRTPLNGVLGMAGLLASTRLDETQRSYLQTLQDCGDHLLNLVNDVLDYAKLEAGRVELEPVETEVERLLQGVAELLSPKAFAAGVEIAWWADPDIPRLMTDDGRLRQILFNLAGNALKFVSSGGVTLSAELLRAGRARAALRFSVADTGPGLAPAEREAVFEEFVQTEAGVRAGGAGLGLAIVKRLSEAFGGAVGVGAADGGGALFWFEAEFAVHRPAAGKKPLAGLAVAVASPSSVVLNAAARQIEALGGRPLAAPDVKSCPPGAAVILVDGALKRVKTPKGIPAIILLAPEERRRIGRARTAGYAGYLVKPLRRESLAGRILTVLGGRAARPGAAAGPQSERVAWDERAAPAATSGARVLLVEDNPVNALLARALLTREGCAVDRAANAAEAIEAAGHGPYDLILMDLRLPDFDGKEASTILRRRGLLTPIVALTANSFEDDRQACLAAGMDDFLSKPLSPQALRAVLHRWVARQAVRGEGEGRTAA